MSLQSTESEFIRSTIVGIQSVAEAIAAVAPERQAKALDAANRSYVRAARELGYDDAAAVKWASIVMLRLRIEMERIARRSQLAASHNELQGVASDPHP